MRAMLKPCSPSGMAQPRMTSSISLVEAGDAGEGSVDGEGGEIVGARGAQGALWGFADGRADGADDNGFGHDSPS